MHPSTALHPERPLFPRHLCRNEGQIVKTLRLSPGQNNSYFLSLNVKNQGQQGRFDLPLSSAELRVIRSIIDVGWEASPLCCRVAWEGPRDAKRLPDCPGMEASSP